MILRYVFTGYLVFVWLVVKYPFGFWLFVISAYLYGRLRGDFVPGPGIEQFAKSDDAGNRP